MRLFLVAALFLYSCSTSKSFKVTHSSELIPSERVLASDMPLKEEDYITLMKGVFEIVLPRIEDSFVQYQEKLPEHLLPFKVRQSPYRGIGTAFAIGSNRFVSAAHVFSLEKKSLLKPYFLRDSEGKTYEIESILKYSQKRDLIEFTLKKAPKEVVPLKISTEARIGQSVFTVGNALGDGIVTRSGNITSFTPEPVDGKWNDIRYSAPASPGNSGGPLLNRNLEVLGIVVRRTSGENLNFAIPIAELEKTKDAEFFFRDVKIEQFKKQVSSPWTFKTKLPLSPAKLTDLASKNYLNFYDKLYADFQIKFKTSIFPTDPSLKSWAKDSIAFSLAALVEKDANDRWVNTGFDWNLVKLEPYRSFIIEKQASASMLFFLERPHKTKLLDFYRDSKSLMDTFLKQASVSRSYAGRRIPILSYGKAHRTSRWSDAYGRLWVSHEWNISYNDRSILLNCLPMPAGVLCIYNSDSYSDSESSQKGIRRVADRIMVDVYGKIRDWQEWSKLPKEWNQSFVPEVKLSLQKEALSWQVGTYRGEILEKTFDDRAELFLSFNALPWDLNKLRLRKLQIAEKNGDMQMGIGLNLEPDERGHPYYKEVWEKMLIKSPPYNEAPQAQGKHSLIVKVFRSRNLPQKIQEMPYATCGIIASVGQDKIKKICQDYFATVNLE